MAKQKFRSTGIPPALETVVDIDPKTGRITYRDVVSQKRAPPGIGGLDFLPSAMRRPIQDWATGTDPIRRSNVQFGRQTQGGPGALDALAAADIPFQAVGGEAFERTGSPLAATAGYIGAAIPGSIARGARSVGRMGLEKLPGALDTLATRMGTQLHAVKPRGGQWIEPDLSSLGDAPHPAFPQPPKTPIDQYVDKNLRKWIKTDMGTTVTDDLARELGLGDAAIGVTNPFDQVIQQVNPQSIRDAAAGRVTNLYDVDYGKSMLKENPWLEKVEAGTPVYELEGGPPDVFSSMMDYARTLPPEKLKNISVPDMLRKSKAWHDEIARKQTEQALTAGSLKTHREYPEGFKWQEIVAPELQAGMPEGYKLKSADPNSWQAITPTGAAAGDKLWYRTQAEAEKSAQEHFSKQMLAQGLDAEGKMMGHCVGSYCEQVSGGGTRIFSLRDKTGRPHVTVEVQPPKLELQGTVADIGWENLPGSLKNAWRDHWEGISDPSEVYLGFSRQGGGSPGAPVFVPKTMLEGVAPYTSFDKQSIQPQIRQIKGKQNAAPVAEYLPYVQDFVRNSPLGSPWGDVRDLSNAGFASRNTLASDLWKHHTDTEVGNEELRGLYDFLEKNPYNTLEEVHQELLRARKGKAEDLGEALQERGWGRLGTGKAAGGSVELEPSAVEHLYSLLLDEPQQMAEGGSVELEPSAVEHLYALVLDES